MLFRYFGALHLIHAIAPTFILQLKQEAINKNFP
jgi:hypothetical protein